jgi:hypothetical protein
MGLVVDSKAVLEVGSGKSRCYLDSSIAQSTCP